MGRASDPNDQSSLVTALDGLIRWKLASMPEPELQNAAQHLFGTAKANATKTLTERRVQAAEASSYEVHHFRKRIEPRLLDMLATALIADSETFKRNRAVAPRLIVAIRRPGLLPEDVLAWEAIEHEETFLRIWSAVYSLRAQLLMVERLVSMDAPRDEIFNAADAALWKTTVLIDLNSEYLAAYGDRLIQSEWEVSPNDLLGLAGWTPSLSQPERDLLAQLRVADNEESFLRVIGSTDNGDRLLLRWRNELSCCQQSKITSTGERQSDISRA